MLEHVGFAAVVPLDSVRPLLYFVSVKLESESPKDVQAGTDFKGLLFPVTRKVKENPACGFKGPLQLQR